MSEPYYLRLLTLQETHGFRAFIEGKTIEDNPHKGGIAVQYKDWCSGFRKAKNANKSQRLYIRWTHSMWEIIDEEGNYTENKLRNNGKDTKTSRTNL